MKKLVFLMLTMIITLFSVTAFAAPVDKPNVVVMYLNNAKTKFDADIDQSVLSALAKNIAPENYNYIDGSQYIEKLNKMGIVDISTAERSDIVDSLEGEDIDYAVFVEVQPMVRKEKMHFFNYGIEMTTQIPFKIIDIVNNKYLYNGKFVEKGEDSTVVGGLGNKGVALKAVEKANQQMGIVIDSRLPKTKAVKVAR